MCLNYPWLHAHTSGLYLICPCLCSSNMVSHASNVAGECIRYRSTYPIPSLWQIISPWISTDMYTHPCNSSTSGLTISTLTEVKFHSKLSETEWQNQWHHISLASWLLAWRRNAASYCPQASSWPGRLGITYSLLTAMLSKQWLFITLKSYGYIFLRHSILNLTSNNYLQYINNWSLLVFEWWLQWMYYGMFSVKIKC